MAFYHVAASESESNELTMRCQLSYCFSDETGPAIHKGEAEARLCPETMLILPLFGDTLLLPLREMVRIVMADYRFEIELISGEQLVLSALGFQYENFGRTLNRLRNEILLHDLLMTEKLRQSGFAGLCEITGAANLFSYHGPAEIRLYETGLVLLPDFKEPFRLPFSDLQSVEQDDYSVTLTSERQFQLKLMQMGSLFNPFLRDLNTVLQDLSQKTQHTIREFLPQFDQSVIRKAASFLRDGKAARRKDLVAISPEIWTILEQKLLDSSLETEYRFLISLAQTDQISIGYKRGLLGDISGEYLWFLAPIYSNDPCQPGNALALEALTVKNNTAEDDSPNSIEEEAETAYETASKTTDESSSASDKATYFFRITSRDEYASQSKPLFGVQQLSDLITTINRAMLAINFRREPIYLPEEKLKERRYLHYFYAVRAIPELRELRERFIGRVMHRSPEQWRRDVTDLLTFNISVSDNTRQWKKSTSDS